MTAAEAHPPTHELAELAEGVLDDRRSDQVRAHLRHCLACQAAIDELAQVTVALRGLPAQRPVPEFVAARVAHALAAERAGGVRTDDSGVAAGTPVGSDQGTVAWFRRRLPQGLAAAASVAVIGLAGYVAVGGGSSGGDDSAGVAAADSAAEASGEDDATTEMFSGRGQSATEESDALYPQLTDDLPATYGLDEDQLLAAVEGVVQQRAALDETCGQVLADELELPLVGSTTAGAGVLVVVDGGGSYDGWLLSTCNSPSAEQLEPPVSLPKPE